MALVKKHFSNAGFEEKGEGLYRNFNCNACGSNRIGDNLKGEYVCFGCGRIMHTILYGEMDLSTLHLKTYKRIFYFNERCSRWECNEPIIHPTLWELIKTEAGKTKKYPPFRRFTRATVSKVLRNVKITPEMSTKFQSKKFKMTPLTSKRFYDKHYEKWKTIIWSLNKDTPKLPSNSLVSLLKRLFAEMQRPFELFRHDTACDGRMYCDKYFDCWHNFMNYDFIFRKLLQIAEIQFHHAHCYKDFKGEFPLVSARIRNTKLRPLFFKIARYNGWPCINDED
jgi:hypothetical protein